MRQFLALEIPEEVREALAGLKRDLEPRGRGWRFLRPESIHLTLRFFGEVPPADDAEHRTTWAEAVRGHPPVELLLDGVGVFPSPGRPRVLWVGLRDETAAPGLAALAGDLEQAARQRGFRAEERAFRPHLTLARVRRGARATAPPADASIEPLRFRCDEVVLFRSVLDPAGARYTVLSRFPLAG
jgi:2'-5' RNA ligase